MPLKASVGPLLVALGGMVVDDVHDHFEPGVVKGPHHVPEAAETLAGPMITGHRREEAQRIIAPVIVQPLLQQMVVVDIPVDRQQLDRGDAEALDEADDVLVAPAPQTCPADSRARPGCSLVKPRTWVS